jgi:tetratricopeptide (TPR) repeat protein
MSLFGKFFKKEAKQDASDLSTSSMSYSMIDENTKPARLYTVTEYAIMAEKAFNEKKYRECIELITKEFQNNMESSVMLILRAKAFYNLNEYKSALPDLNKLLLEFPYHRSANFYRGFILYKLGEIQSAVASISKAIELDPGYHMYYFILNDCYRKKNDHEQANSFLLKAEELELKIKEEQEEDNENQLNKKLATDNSTATYYITEIGDLRKKGIDYLKQNNFEEGLKCFLSRKKLIEGQLYKEHHISFDKATKEQSSYLKLLLSTYETLGDIYQEKKEYLKAVLVFKKALKCSITVHGEDYSNARMHDIYMKLGKVYADLDYNMHSISHYQKALDICKKLFQETGNEDGTKYLTTCYSSIGINYCAAGDAQNALPYFEKVLQINKKTGSTHVSSIDIQKHIDNCHEYLNK